EAAEALVFSCLVFRYLFSPLSILRHDSAILLALGENVTPILGRKEEHLGCGITHRRGPVVGDTLSGQGERQDNTTTEVLLCRYSFPPGYAATACTFGELGVQGPFRVNCEAVWWADLVLHQSADSQFPV